MIEVAAVGRYEVRFSDGRPSRFFYWNDVPGRRVRPEQLSRDQAELAAKTFARRERDKSENRE